MESCYYHTATAGTTTYTFTPANGQCAVNTTMIIVVTTQVTPTFTQLGPLCQNSTAPTLPLLLTMVSLVHGVLLLSVLQLPVPLLIHLLRQMVSVL
jgi:hypothetical protein